MTVKRLATSRRRTASATKPALAGAVLVSLILYAFLPDEHLRFSASGLVGMFISAWALIDLRQRRLASYCATTTLIVAVVGNGIIAVAGLLRVSLASGLVGIAIAWKPWLLPLCNSLIAITAWIVVRALRRSRASDDSLLPEGARRSLNAILLVCLPAAFGQTLSNFVPVAPRYALQVVGVSMELLPFFAGRYSRRKEAGFWIWLIAIASNAVVMALMGARYRAFFPIVLFAVGYMSQLAPKPRRVVIVAAMVLSVPGFFLVGILGILRDELGRDQTSNVSTSHAERMFSVGREVSSSETDHLIIFREGISRMIAWPTFAPVALSPEFVPYRGFGTFLREAGNAVAIYAFAPNAVREYAELKMGTYAANDYGFVVNDLTSVEWGVMADGWSRAGWWSATLFLLVAFFITFKLEGWIATVQVLSAPAKLLFTAFLMSRTMRISSIPLLEFLRSTALYIVALVPLLFLLERALESLGLMNRGVAGGARMLRTRLAEERSLTVASMGRGKLRSE